MNDRVKEARFSRDPEEQFQVGLMFRDGRGVEQDFKEAKDWFRRAAFKEHPAAQFNLAVISAKTLAGTFSSDYETKSWLGKAAKQNHAGAKQLLEMIEAKQDLPDAGALFALDGTSPSPPPADPGENIPEPTPTPESKPEPPPFPTTAAAGTAAVAVAQPDPPPPPASPPTPAPVPVVTPLFSKDLPYADTWYQPEDLAEYASEPWDVRISLDHAPLEEAFYFTVQDPGATWESIGHVLENFALNTGRRGELDTATYPQLPHFQEELFGFYSAGKAGQAKLAIHVNKRPGSEPVDLSEPVAPLLSTCVFHDGSHDYRLLDLVFVIESQPLETSLLDEHRAAFGPDFALFVVDYQKRHATDDGDNDRFPGVPFRAFLGDPGIDATPHVTKALEAAAKAGWITADAPPSDRIFVTTGGYEQLRSLKAEVQSLTERYDRFQSVSASPPALGVPNGYDARIQIMRQQGVDVVRAIFLFAFVYDEHALFGAENWAGDYEAGESFAAIHDAFQYESKFSENELTALSRL